MIWSATCAYAGIEIVSIPAYATRFRIILYALLVAMRRRQIMLRSLERILWTGLYGIQFKTISENSCLNCGICGHWRALLVHAAAFMPVCSCMQTGQTNQLCHHHCLDYYMYSLRYTISKKTCEGVPHRKKFWGSHSRLGTSEFGSHSCWRITGDSDTG